MLCKKCGQEYEVRCKPCKAIADKAWRDGHKEHVREYFKKRWQEPKRKADNKLYKEKQRFGIDAELYVKDKVCVYCGITNKAYKLQTGRRLDINHIDNNGRQAMRTKGIINNSNDNFMVVCRSCHVTWHNKNVRDYAKSKKS